MIFDLQKASLLKRASAYLLDIILLVILVAGFAALISEIVDYDSRSTALDEYYAYYEAKYNVDFDMSAEEFANMTEAELQKYEAAYNALITDTEAMQAFSMLVNLTLIITSFSILFSYVLLEFVVPLIFGNGQTVGKRIFGIAVMRTSGIKTNGVCLFIRTILGKYTIETMIPVLMALMIYFGTIGAIGLFILVLIPLVQIILLFANKKHAQIHDLLADTVAVDMASQMIFENEAAMIAYKNKVQ